MTTADLHPTTQHDADVLLGRLFPVPPTDAATIRALVHLRRELGWRYDVYGSRDGREHVYRSPAPHRHHAEMVSLWQGQLEYRPADGHGVTAALRPESVVEVLGFLRLVGLVPAAELAGAAR